MQLVSWNTINRRYFAKGQGPSKKAWTKGIDSGTVNGKVLLGKVYIDLDDFLSKDHFDAANDHQQPPRQDLLA